MTDWAHCLAGFLDVIGIERAHVLGLSWGGVLAQEFYRLYPARVQTLILADTYAGWKGSLPPDVCERRLAKCWTDASLPSTEFVSRWVPQQFFTPAASEAVRRRMANIVADFHPVGFRLMAKSLAETDTTSLLPSIHVPTLVLWGDDDRRSPLNIAEQFRRVIPNSELAVIPHAGHVSNMEQPGAFANHVRRFCLANLEQSRET
jgi:pimeloyl-ACP methyl ester carboxylesterase